MNSESESMNNLQAWPFAQFCGLNSSLFSGETFPFQGINPATLPINIQHLQLASALQWPSLLTRTNVNENVLNLRRDTSQSTSKDNVESIPFSEFEDRVKQTWKIPHPSKENLQTSTFDSKAPNDCERLPSFKGLPADVTIPSTTPEEKSPSVSHPPIDRPFLKFGVQAILSQVSPPLATGKKLWFVENTEFYFPRDCSCFPLP